jgi:hypothetical protein
MAPRLLLCGKYLIVIWKKENLGGGSEIRTHGGVAPTAVFKTAALNRSAIPPKQQHQ